MENFTEKEQAIRLARAAGRNIVVIGGGTGLSTMLLGLKEYTENITAIVTVTDDGGGSGTIRRDFGVLPPGDVRNCILALADTGSMMNKVLDYRFTGGAYDGQKLGNLFLLALNNICGSFDGAVSSMSRILAVTGRVLPVTNQLVTLKASFEDGSVVEGETEITATKKQSGLLIDHVELDPPDVSALGSVIKAIDEADIIVLGPGSLYTSIIPNLLVGNVADAIKNSSALKIYVLNIMTQEGETEGYTATQHAEAINLHGNGKLIDLCIHNTEIAGAKMRKRYQEEGVGQLFPDEHDFAMMGIKLFGSDLLVKGSLLARHDPLRLAYTMMMAADRFAPRSGQLGESDRYLLSR